MTIKNEPLIRISKRDGLSKWKSWAIRIIALALALVLNAIIIYAISGMNPLSVYKAMFEGVFGTQRRMWAWIRDLMMLLCRRVFLRRFIRSFTR